MTAATLAATITPAVAFAQAPGAPAASPTSAPAEEAKDTAKPYRRTVVPAKVREPVELLQNPGDRIVLSDEKKVSRWAHAQETSKIGRFMRRGGPSVGRLRFLTEDRVAEVYLVLEARMDSKARKWLRIRVPRRPNGRRGWVREDALSALYVVRTRLVVNRRTLWAKLYKNGRKIWSARVGVGKNGTKTPRGNFYIRERLKGLGNKDVYGPWAFGTSAYSNLSDWPGGGVVGIHGTNQPRLIPGRPSHGCIRVTNAKIRKLARLMPVGTPVRIL